MAMKITPMEALEHAKSALGDRDTAAKFLLNWLVAGEVKAQAAVTHKLSAPVVKNKKIATETWKSFETNCPPSLWHEGRAKSDLEEYFGIKFDDQQVKNVIKEHAYKLPIPSETGTERSTSSGRFSGFHGEAIASLTARYLLLDDASLEAIPLNQAKVQIVSIYKDLGAPPPVGRNLDAIARGILKGVRANRP